jgi:hypothetical protein
VFAYLPTETVPGFPFLLNANFVLAASRERLHARRWNEWLLSLVPALFCEAFMLLLRSLLHPTRESRAIASLPDWAATYALVRPPHEYSGSPLKSTGVAIIEALKAVPCVVGHDCVLRHPAQCRFASEQVFTTK